MRGHDMRGQGLNQIAHQYFVNAQNLATALRLRSSQLANGTSILDFGVQVAGGLEAGVHMAQICMAGQASINLTSGDRQVWFGPWVQVATDHPVAGCMLAQYAGWPVKHDKFFAMGSGPMRVRRGKEELLSHLSAQDDGDWAVGTLECDGLPTEDVAAAMADECHTTPDRLFLAVAPTRSTAGCVQVVARSTETCLHKLHELGFDLSQVHSAYGIAPLPPPTPDFALGIGRTNDAILYGGHVSLWVDAEDEEIATIGPQLPSSASADFGQPFAEIFKRCNFDFYKIDAGLFSPAEVTIMNRRSGHSWRFGGMRGDLILKSFGTQTLPS
jgi:methenyltetrahydromethanopterin cyclohydrolase